MAQLYRVRTTLTGMPGGPGVSTMYFTGMQTALDSVRAFWFALAAIMPDNITVQVENTGDIIEDSTGILVGSWSKPAVAPVDCTGVGPYAAPCGALIRWETGAIADGHRVRGKTFIVPLLSAQFDSSGSLAPSTLGYLQSPAQAFQFEQSLDFVIWHRPRAAKAATPTSPAVTPRLGSSALVTAYSVPDKAAVLRSRRD